MRASSRIRIAINQSATIERPEQPFVRINDKTVGKFDSNKQMSHTGRTQCRRTVCPVNMKPSTEFACLLACCHKIVDYAKVRRARSCDDCTNTIAILRVELSNRLTQINARHAAFCVGFNFDDVCIHCVCSKTNRRVCARRCHQNWSNSVVYAFAVLSPTPARGDQRRQIAGRATANKNTGTRNGKVRQTCDPPQRLVLGVDSARTLEPRTRVNV